MAQLETFIALWSGLNDKRGTNLFTPEACYESSTFGQVTGATKVASLLKEDFTELDEIELTATNVIVRADENKAFAAAYLLGQARKFLSSRRIQAAHFGGVMILEFDIKRRQPLISIARTQLTWAEGASILPPEWNLPTGKGWQPGDSPAVIVSELDSPWKRVPVSSLPSDEEALIAEVWYRYAWGLDLADFAQFAHCFTENVEAELPPMGIMQGRRILAGTLKAFRMPWPWIQHYGTPVRVSISADGETASMILGRIIPGQTELEGEKIYGAHYRIELIKNARGYWQISRMKYYPGWIASDFIPDGENA